MNKFLFALTAGLVVMASCNKQENAPQQIVKGEKAVLNVTISGGPQAKAASFDENKVDSLQVFVFSGNELDAYGSAKAMTLTLNATTGQRTVYALVNAPDLSGIVKKDELLAGISTLSDNAPGSFVMIGSDDCTLSSSSNITIEVSRLAARLMLHKITRNLSSDGLAALGAEKFELVRIYAADVVCNTNYAGNMAAPYIWKNSTLADSSIDTSDEFLLRTLSPSAAIAQGASYEEDMCVYVYPNPTLEDSGSAHCTRLVVECKIDGQFYTYPVVIPKVESNKSYEINNLILTRLGNQSDGDNNIDEGETDRIESFEIPFGITVKGWDTVLLGNAEGVVTI
ncbi:MAG: hypothetical protein ACI3Y4_00410 [Candidatus Cryptobacteroides sp.]